MTSYDRVGILEALPQQPPFLFLDEAEVGPEGAIAKYTVTGEEFFLRGHFKNDPVFPASILFEALGQVACLWVLDRAPALTGKPVPNGQVYFASMDGAHVYRKTRPGDYLIMEVKLHKLREPLAIFSGHVVTGEGERVAKIEKLMLAFGAQVFPSEAAQACS